MASDEATAPADDAVRVFAVGRDAANDVVIKDTRVSRQHALITDLGGGRYRLADRGSANGTFLLRDGHWVRVEKTDVLADDRIRLGERVMTVAALFEPLPDTSDIFISYSSADRDVAGMIADAFANQGWKIWWDQVIPPGKNYDEVIEEQVANARCVVVLWSNTSVSSRWVRAEAGDAMSRGMLIPALIEDTSIPLVFRQLQAADLVDWQGEAGHPGLARLLESVRTGIDRTGGGEGTPQKTIRRPAPRPAGGTHAASAAPAAHQLSAGRLAGLMATVVVLCGVWAIPGGLQPGGTEYWLFRVERWIAVGDGVSVMLAIPLALRVWVPGFTMAQFWGVFGTEIAGFATMIALMAIGGLLLPDVPGDSVGNILTMGVLEIPISLLTGAVVGFLFSQVLRIIFLENGGPGFMRRMILVWMCATTAYAIAIFLSISIAEAAVSVSASADSALMMRASARMVADTVLLGLTYAFGLFLTFRLAPRVATR